MKKVVMMILTVVLTMGYIMSGPNVVMASDHEPTYETQGQDAGIMADKIVVRSRVFEGRVQYRRFNATKNRWVDPAWIDEDDFFGSR